MKLMKLSLVAALALGSLLACSTVAMAQDTGGGNGGGKKGGRSVEARLERMSTELNLTDEQKPKVKAVLEDTAKKMQEIPREERRDKMPALMEDQNKKLKEILTPDQYTKLQSMRQNAKKGGPAGEKKSE
jgi:Spy/CpxP family protein refolding chaperone